MTDGMQEELARQLARLLEEAERPMRVEEILPHLDPVMPTPNDVAEVLTKLAKEREVDREGSYFSKATPVPVDALFLTRAGREAGHRVVDIMRALDAGEGVTLAALLVRAAEMELPRDQLLDAITVLRNAGEIYSFAGDRLRLAKP